LKLIDNLERNSKIYAYSSILTLLMEIKSGGISMRVSSAYYRHVIPGFQGPTF